MKHFSCQCGHVFEAPDDAAGAQVECPRCHWAFDVPLPCDIEVIAEEETSHTAVHPLAPHSHSEDDSDFVFSEIELDADGNPVKPRIAPLEMSDAGSSRRHVLLELGRLHNLIVIFSVIGICLFGTMTTGIILLSAIFFIPVVAAIVIVVFAHYGNVVNEIGVEERDKLPRMLGDLRMYEDIWHPSAAVATALVLCYGPAIGILFAYPLSSSAGGAYSTSLALIGTFLFPAVALTLLTSGAIANLRPDRVLRVICATYHHYLGMVGVLFVGLAAVLWAGLSLLKDGTGMGPVALGVPAWTMSFSVASPLLVFGIFVMHYFCWHLGLYYRANSEQFSWVGRYFPRDPGAIPVARRKPRYVNPPGMHP